MALQLELITGPTQEPISLQEARDQCRVDGTQDDATLAVLISAAREQAEKITRRALLTQTWELVLDAWPEGDTIKLPKPPLRSVTSVTYTDADGASHTFASSNYVVATGGTPGRLVLADGASWPDEDLAPAEAIRVRYVAGWATAADVPSSIRLAVRLMVSHWFENREATVIGAGLTATTLPLGVDALLETYRHWRF